MRTFCEIRWYHGTWLPSYKKGRGQVFLMLRLSNSEAVRACTIKLLNLKVAKHEKVAIYVVTLRICTDRYIISSSDNLLPVACMIYSATFTLH